MLLHEDEGLVKMADGAGPQTASRVLLLSLQHPGGVHERSQDDGHELHLGSVQLLHRGGRLPERYHDAEGFLVGEDAVEHGEIGPPECLHRHLQRDELLVSRHLRNVVHLLRCVSKFGKDRRE